MNFDFSDEQKLLKEYARKFLKERCGRKVVRRVFEGDEPFDRELWRGIVELEWPGMAIADEFGGIGCGYLELCVVAEELGRALAPVPFSSSVYLASEAIQLAGTDEQKRRYLPRLTSGEIIGTFALAEGPGAMTEAHVNARVRDGALFGTKVPVADGDVADFAVVAAQSSAGPRGVSLYVVDLNEPGVRREQIATIDPTRSHARLFFDTAACEQLGASEGWPLIERLLDRAAVLMAFEQLGGADAALEMATEYAKNRYAFGRPIGSFQAIKHKLADAFMANELARSNCYYAAWALSSDAPDLPVAAASARIAATQAFAYIAAENIQTHGGIGFTWESDCQLFYRRAKLLALSLSGVHRWKNRLMNQLELQTAAEPAAVGAQR